MSRLLRTDSRSRTRRNTFRPAIDGLPQRWLLTGGVSATLDGTILRVTGTEAAERIWVQKTYGPGSVVGVAVEQAGGGRVQVPIFNEGRLDQVVASSRIGRVAVDARGGDDVVLLGPHSASPAFDPQYEIDLPATLLGGGGYDLLVGGLGNDEILGDEGNDEIHGRDGDDAVDGGAGDDWLYGGSGANRLSGQGGNDSLFSGADDVLSGGLGDDRLIFQPGTAARSIDGGAGSDTVDLSAREGGVFLSLADGYGTMLATQRREFRGIVNVEDLVGTRFVDHLIGSAGRNTISGGDGDDLIQGGGDADRLFGGPGRDRRWGEGGADELNGDAGEDDLNGGDDRDTLTGDVGIDRLVGGIGDDTLIIGLNFNALRDLVARPIVNPGDYLGRNAGTDTFRISADLGTFGRDVLQPVIAQAQNYTRELQPLLDVLNRRLPFFDMTVAQLVDRVGAGQGSLAVLTSTIDTINRADLSGLSGRIELGSFQVSSPSLGDIRTVAVGNALERLNLEDRLASLSRFGVQVPVLNDARRVVQILLGQDIDIVQYELGFDFNSGQIDRAFTVAGIPVLGDLRAILGGRLEASARATIAYDTAGFRSGNLRDGIYIRSDSYAQVVADVSAGFGVGANLLLARGEASIHGGIAGRMRLQLNDSNRDGKVRLNEITGSRFLRTSGDLKAELYVRYKYRVFNPIPFSPGWWVTKEGRRDLIDPLTLYRS